MRNIAITGVGTVSPLGASKERFWQSLQQGYCGVGRLVKFTFPREISCGQMQGAPLGRHAEDKRFRRSADVSRYAIAAIAMAVQDAGIESIGGSDTAMIMGITHGALDYTQAFHGALVVEGAGAASPIHFSESVLNAPAGNASICFGVQGPVHTIVGHAEAAVKSIMLAQRLLHGGVVGKAVVVSSEELNALSLSCYSRLGISPLSEGAGALIMESADTAGPETPPYCYITGIASICIPDNPDAALNDAVTRCMDGAAVGPRDIDCVLTARSMSACGPLNCVPTGSIVSLTGYAFSTTALLHVITACLAIKKGSIPASVIGNNILIDKMERIMICTAEKNGSAAAVILSKYPRHAGHARCD
jgi:3-oxoacyl-(acyl-carrier-protein) synthase